MSEGWFCVVYFYGTKIIVTYFAIENTVVSLPLLIQLYTLFQFVLKQMY